MQIIPDTLCYLNGEYGSLRDAKVSVLDRGFIFGDGVYEVIPVYGRRLFRFDEHMTRHGKHGLEDDLVADTLFAQSLHHSRVRPRPGHPDAAEALLAVQHQALPCPVPNHCRTASCSSKCVRSICSGVIDTRLAATA